MREKIIVFNLEGFDMKITRLVLLTSLTVLMFVVALNGCYSGGNPYGPGNPTPTPTPGGSATPTPSPTQPPSALSIDARMDKIAYNVGEEMTISVLVGQSSYLHIFDITPDGQVTRIFPNAYAIDNYVQAGQTYIIPSSGDQYRLKISEPRGTERLRIVAMTDNGNLVPERDFSSDKFAKYNGTTAQFDQAIDQQLATMAAGSYGSVNITFQVK